MELKHSVDFGDGRPRKVYPFTKRLIWLDELDPDKHKLLLVQDEGYISEWIIDKECVGKSIESVVNYYWDTDRMDPEWVLLDIPTGL
jgi:hypothetical protein